MRYSLGLNVLQVPQGGSSVAFGVGMKIEAVDPLNLATICVATVMKVCEMLVTGALFFLIQSSVPTRGSRLWFKNWFLR